MLRDIADMKYGAMPSQQGFTMLAGTESLQPFKAAQTKIASGFRAGYKALQEESLKYMNNPGRRIVEKHVRR